MPKVRLTKTSVESLPCVEGKQIEYMDTRIAGFGVRCSSYTKTYIVTGRVKGKKNATGITVKFKESIGKTDTVSFFKAEEIARGILEDARLGISPGDRRAEKEHEIKKARKHKEAEAAKDITLWQVFGAYVAAKKKLKVSTKAHYELILRAHVPDWLDRPVREITANMVVKRHAEIKSPAVADTVFRVVRALMNFALNFYDDIIYKNPVGRLTAVSAWHKVERKQSYIEPKHLKEFMQAVLDLDSPDGRDILRVLLFTGARKTEAESLRFRDIDFHAGIVTFRETKSGKPLEVPVSSYVMDIFKERKTFYYDDKESYVFPSPHIKGAHIKDLRYPCKVVGGRIGFSYTPHDLRRTFASICNAINLSPYTIKRLMNHALPGQDVTEGYIQFPELRRDVEAVADTILRHAGMKQGKVVQLRKKEG